MKLIRRVILAIVLLVILAGVIFYLRIDRIIKTTVESQASDSLKLPTTLNSANLSLVGGKLNLNQLHIGSPAGYSAPHMLELGDTNLAVSYGQLRQNPVHVQSLTLDKPKLVIEQQNGELNFKKAMDQMPKGDSTSSGAPSTKLIIDELTIKDAQVVVRPGMNLPGMPSEIPVTIPSMVMHNVGSGDGSQNGAALKDVVMQVITAMAGSASESGSIPDQLKGLMQANIGATVAQLGGEAQKRVAALIPGQFGQTLSTALHDPQSLISDPGKALQNVGGLLNAKSAPGTATNQDIQGKAIDTLQGLLGTQKKKDSQK